MNTYSELMNATMTLQQCKDVYNPDIYALLILFTIGILIFFGMTLYFGHKYQNTKNFIKDCKLEKKYQEWKKDNKGLI